MIKISFSIFSIKPRKNKSMLCLHPFIHLKSLLLFCAFLIFGFSFLFAHTTAAVPLQQSNADTKDFSGIHLGNKLRDIGSDWTDEELRLIDPDLDGFEWPSIVVVLSNQVYDIDRDSNNGCRITKARIRKFPPDDKPIHIAQYLTRAAQAGVKIVIRVDPSPGSFKDWDKREGDPGYRENHELEIPGRSNLCSVDLNFYRPPFDIADEIRAIHILNQSEDIGISEYGFEPANEPNTEWYAFRQGNIPLESREAWDDMNSYFKEVVAEVKAHNLRENLDANIFTPPMAQAAFAEPIHWGECDDALLLDRTVGYDAIMDMIRASDGFSWHNYWHMGKEEYYECVKDGGGGHVSYHFPNALKEHIKQSNKPTIITEADLFSKRQLGNVDTKEENKAAVAYSLQRFFYQEWLVGGGGGHYGVKPDIALWLLNDNTSPENVSPSDENCTDVRETCTNDHNWHEAYRDRPDGTIEEKNWFKEWWSSAEVPLYGLGDVNCDEKVTAVDALHILRHVIGYGTPNDIGTCTGLPNKPDSRERFLIQACDVSGDDECDSIDALFILMCDVGLERTLCPNPEWYEDDNNLE